MLQLCQVHLLEASKLSFPSVVYQKERNERFMNGVRIESIGASTGVVYNNIVSVAVYIRY